MPLTNSRLRDYDSNVLRLPDDRRKEYHRQVDYLVACLDRELAANTDLEVTRVMKAGSFAKHTILRRSDVDPVDVDVVLYFAADSVDRRTLETLNEDVHSILMAIYPNKALGDFEIQRKATTISFVGTGLNVDVVPIIADPRRPGYGWQYSTADDSFTETCPSAHLEFIRDRKAQDRYFRTLVRLSKRWRNYAELKPLKSFAIELILGHLVDKGSSGTVERRFEEFLLYMAQSGLRQPITFPENGCATGQFDDPVVIIDPASATNNVAARIDEREREQIVEVAKTSWETAHFASAEDDDEVWKELFGPRFGTGD